MIEVLAAASILMTLAGRAEAQVLKERSAEVRFQLDFKVSDAALAALMPKGFSSDVATSGPAKDCNLRVIFIDRVTINGPDNNPLGRGSNQLAFVVAPVKDPTGQSVQLVIGALTADPADAPGPFGNYIAATTHSVKRSVTVPASGNDPVLETQDWVFAAPTGEHLELHVTFERATSNYRPQYDRTYFSAKDPSLKQPSKEELVLDILRNVTTTPRDKVKSYKFTGGGGSYAKLLDGTEKILSWDNVLWMTRLVFQP
jgi:hypothetical protein